MTVELKELSFIPKLEHHPIAAERDGVLRHDACWGPAQQYNPIGQRDCFGQVVGD